jgi:RNA polymerase sigma factor (sigma-70 family)
MAADINAAYQDYIVSCDETPLEEVIRSGAGIVRHFAALYGGGLDFDDLYQTGMIGLIRAAKSYDASCGAAFSTWASVCVISEIRHFVRHERAYQCPAAIETLRDEAEDFIGEIVAEGAVPCDYAVAAKIGLPREGMREVMKAGLVPLAEIDLEKIEHIQSFHLALEDKIALEQAMEKLGALQKKVLNALFYRGLTQQQIADELGISQRRVSRVKCVALALLQELIDPTSFHLVEKSKSFHNISRGKKVKK